MAGAGQGHAVFLSIGRRGAPPPALRRPHGHQHRFAERRAAVVDRRVGNVHAGQGSHHRLVFVDELQRALAGLGLIRRVGGHELAASGDVPNGGGNVVVVAAGAQEARAGFVLPRAGGHLGEHRHLVNAVCHGAQVGVLQRGRDLVEQFVRRGGADALEHGANVGGGVRDEGHADSLYRGARQAIRTTSRPLRTRRVRRMPRRRADRRAASGRWGPACRTSRCRRGPR